MNWDEITHHCETFESSGARRRTAEQMEAIDYAIIRTANEYKVITVRQLYYQLVSRGVIPKTEAAYKNLVVRRSGILRKDGLISYRKFSDSTRWMRKPATWDNLREAIEDTVWSYRRDLWKNQEAYVEIWCEKDALAGVLHEITSEYDVPLMVSRGYASLSFLHSAAEQICYAVDHDKAAYLYHFGDFDPSGRDAARAIEETLRDMGCYDFNFQIEAVTADQIAEYTLPTRPTKTSDTRSRGWDGGSVEVDAIAPDTLQEICRSCIEQHIDQAQLEKTRRAEQAEKEALDQLYANFEEDIYETEMEHDQ